MPREQLNQLADEIFELTNLVAALRSRSRKADSEELSEIEFLTLNLLAQHGTMNVGDIQRELGILPAQMSRVTRALEGKAVGPLVVCSINEQDRRKIDVTMTEQGEMDHQAYRDARRAMSVEFLKHLSPSDREVFMRVIRSFRQKVAKSLKKK
jgi:DNA-binding MarR family transcriptional regulator